MPYPIAKLAYGLRCRLSELSTPVERYNVQTAAGDVSICPPELLFPQKSFDITEFRCKNGTVSMYTKITPADELMLFPVNGDSFVRCKGFIRLCGFDIQAFDSDIFGHCLYNIPSYLILMDCTLSKPFFEKLKKQFPEMIELRIVNSFNGSDILNFTDVLPVFPNLKCIGSSRNISKNWMQEILQFKNYSLRILDITYDDQVQEIFDFNDFLVFLKAQRPGFSISITCSRSLYATESTFSKLKTYLDQNLVRRNAPCKKKHTIVSMFYKGSPVVWYLPSDDDLRRASKKVKQPNSNPRSL